MKSILPLLAVLALAACSDDLGDECHSPGDCSSELCFQDAKKFPDGYCTQKCRVGADEECPSGAVCVDECPSGGCDESRSEGSCLISCRDDGDCSGRPGYVCREHKSRLVCIGKE